MNKKLLYWTIVSALAGFLFGFDTVVISGAEKELQALWNHGPLFHGIVIMGSALWGTVIGAIFGNFPTDKLGRKQTLIWIGVLYTVSAIGSGIAWDPWSFAIFRFIGGLGVGASTIAAPAYISEIAPAKDRGKLVATYQFNIVFGILIAFVSNYLIGTLISENAWRWMIGAEAIPAIIYTLLVFGVPESPRWLMSKRNDESKARNILAMLLKPEDVELEVSKIKADQSTVSKGDSIYMSKYRRPLILAFLIAFFNQFSGINALLYYAPRILNMAGLDKSAALISSIGIGLVNMVFTLLGLMLIDRLGRKQLMYIGSLGYIISLGLIAAGFTFLWSGMSITLFFFVFIASHAIGQGAVIWVFISEIFPNHLRAQGQAFGSGTHWVLAAIIPAFTPFLFDTIGAAKVFALFALMMVLQLLFVWKMMPETKGIDLEDLQDNLLKK